MSQHSKKSKAGRPLSFNREEACRKAMLLFWRNGYEGTSLEDLTRALNVNPSSIYSGFGDKKGLFYAALDLYTSTPVKAEKFISECSSAKEAATAMLTGSADLFTGEDTPSGCLMATAAISCSPNSLDVQLEIARIRSSITDALRNKISEDTASGHLPADVNAKVLAQYTIAVIQGMSTLARDGKSRDDLRQVAEQALHAWPAGA
jgi:AcrR family transcriptional regulator